MLIGMVISVESGRLTIQWKKQILQISVHSRTRFTRGKDRSSFSSIRPGERITVSVLDWGGRLSASYVYLFKREQAPLASLEAERIRQEDRARREVERKRREEQARLETGRRRKERERLAKVETERKLREEQARLEEERRRLEAQMARLERERRETQRRKLEAERKRKEQERLAKVEAERKRRERDRGPMRFRFRRGPVNESAIAVIIGNRNYTKHSKDIPNVAYAHNDADAIYEYVTKALGYREGNIFRLKDATQAQLITTFGTEKDHRGPPL